MTPGREPIVYVDYIRTCRIRKIDVFLERTMNPIIDAVEYRVMAYPEIEKRYGISIADKIGDPIEPI